MAVLYRDFKKLSWIDVFGRYPAVDVHQAEVQTLRCELIEEKKNVLIMLSAINITYFVLPCFLCHVLLQS